MTGYISRLNVALRECAELAGQQGYVTAQALAARMGVTERMARNYLMDLLDLGALEYAGGGRYVLTGAARAKLEEGEVLGGEYTVEAVASARGWGGELSEYMLEKVYRLKGALRELGSREGVRRKLLQAEPPEGFSGGRLILSSRDVEPREVRRVAGEASGYALRGYVLAGLVPITVAYMCSVAAIVELNEVGQVEDLKFLRRPDVRDFRGGEPFDEGLVELAVEHPELLIAGRKVAARLLCARLKLANMLDAVERGVELAVSKGTLLPHGFVLPGSELFKRLEREVAERYEKLVERARERGVTLASIIDEPRDYRFYEAVRGLLGLKLARVSDAAFLSYVLDQWEYTAPLRVSRERGRSVEDWYEFYWKVGERLIKVEYVTRSDPVEAQRELIASLAPNLQVGGMPVGVSEAESAAKAHLSWIRRAFEQALNRAFREGGP